MEIYWWLEDGSHEAPVIFKTFPCHDVIIITHRVVPEYFFLASVSLVDMFQSITPGYQWTLLDFQNAMSFPISDIEIDNYEKCCV